MHSACQPEVPGGLPVMLDTNPAMKTLRSEAGRGLSRAPVRGAATERVAPRSSPALGHLQVLLGGPTQASAGVRSKRMRWLWCCTA